MSFCFDGQSLFNFTKSFLCSNPITGKEKKNIITEYMYILLPVSTVLLKEGKKELYQNIILYSRVYIFILINSLYFYYVSWLCALFFQLAQLDRLEIGFEPRLHNSFYTRDRKNLSCITRQTIYHICFGRMKITGHSFISTFQIA